MKIVIAGKNNIAVDVLKYALDEFKLPIFVVLNKTETFKNNFQKSLGFYANKWKVPVIKLEEVYDFNDCVFISLEFDRIINPDLFKSKKLFNIHFSLLPAYKGMYTSAWPLINGETRTGVTLHKIDSGIDTGEIIDQKKISIAKSTTSRDLYLNYVEEGTKLTIKNLNFLIENTFKYKKQSFKGSSYYNKESIDYLNLRVNYIQTAFQISNQIRAFTFREYQLPKFKNTEINSSIILKSRSNCKAGSILKEDNLSFIIATIDFDIKLNKDLFSLLCNYCEINDFYSLEKLLKFYNLDLEVKSGEGWTALMIAAYNGSLECAVLLIDAGADVNACNYNFTSVLMFAKSNALKNNNTKLIDILIDNGANIYAKDIYNKNVIDWVKNENTELHEHILSKI
tara:strand:+ start:100 stop:1290 length:1191 start_codon:yes stop_codon:yes gene_type:complete